VETFVQQTKNPKGVFMIKNLFVSVIVSTVAGSAFAAQAQSSLSLITKGQYRITDRTRACAPNEMCSGAIAARAQVVLNLPLKGCLDSAFVSYNLSTNEQTGAKKLVVNAINIHDPRSNTARCIAAPIAIKTIDLQGSVMRDEDLQVEFVQNLAN